MQEQIFAIQNTKNAAHYDLKTVNVITPDKRTMWAADAACEVLGDMKAFFGEECSGLAEVLDYQMNKFIDADNRYAWKVRNQFADGFVEKGLQLCREQIRKYR